MDVFLAYVLPFLAFVAIYAVLLAKARRDGRDVRIAWGWLAAIVVCAGAAALLGAVL